jgi:type IV pilus assembly protein PilC
MLYLYKALTKSGEERSGSIDALNEDVAISALQRRGLIVVMVQSADKKPFFERDLTLFSRVSTKDLVIISRQMSTLFDAQLPALQVFRLLGEQTEKPIMGKALNEVADDIQSGMTISQALSKHPSVFSDFYVNMVKAGEETGKLNDVLIFLADYLERTNELTSKIRGALLYPAFVIFVFIAVMILLLTLVVPRLTAILTESGQELPIYTKIVIGISDFIVNYGLFALVVLILAGGAFWYYVRNGTIPLGRIILSIPVFGKLLRELYLSRIADNMHTMLSSSLPMVKAVEVTRDVVGNKVYVEILNNSIEAIKEGSTLSKSFEGHDEITPIMVQMVRIGEETGDLANLLKKLAVFYSKEVYATADTLVSLIEPAMIVLLGLGVGFVLAAVLMPIYNLAGSF